MQSFLHLPKKDSKGQSLVEFALALPILVMLVLGIIQFGIIWYGQIAITSASREGARLASVGEDESEILLRINKITIDIPFLYVDLEDVIIEPDPKVIGEEVSVKVSGTVDVIIPFLDYFIGKDKHTVYSETSMRCQHY